MNWPRSLTVLPSDRPPPYGYMCRARKDYPYAHTSPNCDCPDDVTCAGPSHESEPYVRTQESAAGRKPVGHRAIGATSHLSPVAVRGETA